MKNFFLTKIRLSWYFWIFFVIYLVLSYFVPSQNFGSGALTLFSVNSFLYGFYIAPILSAQKGRIEELHKIVRAETNALFSMMIHTKNLSKTTRNEIQSLVVDYVQTKLKHIKPDAGEKQYEKLITYCFEYKGDEKDEINQLLESLVSNQQNRTNFAMQVGNKVFANEWQIMAILFSITLGFILTVNIDTAPLLNVIRALLCTGLTMLIVILVKLNTLTHKKAKQMWEPFKKFVATDFYRID
ncbi:MAG: hypothetical protein WCF91_01665 [bacterium]